MSAESLDDGLPPHVAPELPPLPEFGFDSSPLGLHRRFAYSPAEMSKYARAAVAQERERCVAICEALRPSTGAIRATLNDAVAVIREGKMP